MTNTADDDLHFKAPNYWSVARQGVSDADVSGHSEERGVVKPNKGQSVSTPEGV